MTYATSGGALAILAYMHLHVVRPDDWESHRTVRLEMLEDAPDAFWYTYADEAVYDEADWRERIEGAWLVQAWDADGVVGSAGLGSHWEPERHPELDPVLDRVASELRVPA